MTQSRTTLVSRRAALAAAAVASAAVVASALPGGAGPAAAHGKRPKGIDLAPLAALVTQAGVRFDPKRIAGRPAAVFFGYTNCPDICPTTMLEMSRHLDQLGADGERLEVIFVTIDPERDDAAHLKDYVGSFHPRIVALTGATLEVEAVAHAFGASYEKVAAKDGDGSYTMDHTAKVFLIDRYGLVASHLESRQTEKEQLALLRKLLAQ